MRIRTVKPEFWSHPVMMRLPDGTNLLALALLNMADDEGYFYADADVIRGALFPKKNSTMIRRSIDELSSIGYLSVRDHSTHGPIGRIVAFSSHQRVDRPKPSALKALYDSTNNRRTIDDESTQEQGTGNREGNREHDISIPSGSQSSELPKTQQNGRSHESKAEIIYAAYPIKKGKKRALDAIKKALKAGADHEEILGAVKKFARADCPKPHASTYFHQERWADEDNGEDFRSEISQKKDRNQVTRHIPERRERRMDLSKPWEPGK